MYMIVYVIEYTKKPWSNLQTVKLRLEKDMQWYGELKGRYGRRGGLSRWSIVVHDQIRGRVNESGVM
jgi:hypothetical protein